MGYCSLTRIVTFRFFLFVFVYPYLSFAQSSQIIDNTDTGFSIVGYWQTYSSVPGFYGTDYRQTKAGTGTKAATWTFQIGTSGKYEILAQWSSKSNRSPDAPYTIKNNGVVLSTVLIDQRINGGQFNLLGTYILETGKLEVILGNNSSSNTEVIADAVEIIKVIESVPIPTPEPTPDPTPTPTTEPTGAVFYISPDGSDSNSGTSASSPFRTFSFAISQLLPGDTLVLLDGIYSKLNSGLLNINCLSGAVKGTDGKPIAVKAQHERKAKIFSDGSQQNVKIQNCDWWTIEGLVAENSDNSKFTGARVGTSFYIYNSSNIVIKRNIGLKPNRYSNSPVFFAGGNSKHVLFIENEAYDFHRHGFSIGDSSFITLRRNYANSRNRANLPDGYLGHKCCPDRGDEGFVNYGSTDTRFENNISEGNELIGGWGPRSEWYGNISLNDFHGAVLAKGFTSNGKPHPKLGCVDWIVKNNVTIKSQNVGTKYESCANLLVENDTKFDNGKRFTNDGTLGNNAEGLASGVGSMTWRNILVVGSTDNGFQINQVGDFTLLLEYLNAFGNNGGNYGAGMNSRKNSIEMDPKMFDKATGEGCIVYVPDNSPMKGVGKNGLDIGANIIYRYENGVLTNEKLWDQLTGQFPCGAVVAGVNDNPSNSCIGVHQRLNVGVNGCPIP